MGVEMDVHAAGRSARAAIAVVLLASGCGGDLPPTTASRAPAEVPSRAEIDAERIGADLDALQAIADANDGVRTVGTPGYDASVAHVAHALADLGFQVDQPEVPYTGFRELPGATVEVGGRTWSAPDDLHALIYSAGGDVEGPITLLAGSGCDPADFAGSPDGAIAVTTQGGCFRRDQALNAIAAGASALVIGYADRDAGEIFRPTLIDPDGMTIPVISVSAPVVAALEAAEGEEASLRVATELEDGTFRQVIGELGSGPSVVVVGAHLDSVFEGPGLNDNGSGVAALLEIGRALDGTKIPDGWAVRLAFWGAEELGTIGSRAYAASLDPDEVVAYLNVDMAGSVNGANLVYDEASAARGSERITDLFATWFDDHGQPWAAVDLGGSSDHAGFQAAGIPTGGLFAGATSSGSAAAPAASAARAVPDPCYHLACDDRSNVDVERVATFAAALADVVLALTIDAPER
jgi:Zn-dependent M28 family amino/carboxypeptidase